MLPPPQVSTSLFSMSQRRRLRSIKFYAYLSLAVRKTKQNKLQNSFPGCGKKLASCYPGVAFAPPPTMLPMATGLLQYSIGYHIFKIDSFIRRGRATEREQGGLISPGPQDPRGFITPDASRFGGPRKVNQQQIAILISRL